MENFQCDDPVLPRASWPLGSFYAANEGKRSVAFIRGHLWPEINPETYRVTPAKVKSQEV